MEPKKVNFVGNFGIFQNKSTSKLEIEKFMPV